VRNKILSSLWYIVGFIAGIRVAAFPLNALLWVIFYFVGAPHKPVSAIIGGISVIVLLIGGFLGGRWFNHLFYRGELLWYRPDDKSS